MVLGVKKSRKTILVAAGGTGGHIYPALSLVDTLQSHAEIIWLGTNRPIEERILASTSWPTYKLVVRPLRGGALWKLPLALASLAWAIVQTAWYFYQHQPDLVVVTGGYVSFTAGICAYIWRVPLCVCEQNQRAGWTNKMLAPFAHTLFTAYPRVFHGYCAKVKLFGNPIRQDIVTYHKWLMENENKQHRVSCSRVLVLGGSQGATSLNHKLPVVLHKLERVLGRTLTVTHQCGVRDVDKVAAAYKEYGISAKVVSFIDDMTKAYAHADVVIARAGALSMSEIMAVGVPSVIIPLPNSRDNHQLCNARFHEQKGACVVVLDSELDAHDVVVAKLRLLLHADYCREKMIRHALALAKPKADKAMAEHCLQILGFVVT